MKARISYSPDELAWIKAHCTDDRRAAHAQFCALFGRKDVSLANYAALAKRKGWLTGRTGRFAPGHASTAGRVWGVRPGCVATQFKKGNVPHTTRFEGHERVTIDGYVEISVRKTNKHTGFERSYVLKHVWLWEQRNGPVPKEMCLKCLDGNRQNTDPENWIAIPRALLPRLAGGRHGRLPYDSAAPALKPAILATARLAHAVRKARQVPA